MTPRENARNLLGLLVQAQPGTAARLLLYAAAYVLRRSTGWEFYRGGRFDFRFGSFQVAPGRGDLGMIGEIFVNRGYHRPAFIPSDGEVCIDVGANIGCVSIQWRKSNPTGRILAIEAHPLTVALLRANLALNAGADVVVVPAAVGSRDGTVELEIDRNNNSIARVVGSHLQHVEAYPSEERVTVDSVTLDSLVHRHALERIDLLKIDIEGFEAECLKGARDALTITDRVILEFHSEALRTECRRILEGQGFAVSEFGSLMFASRQTPTR